MTARQTPESPFTPYFKPQAVYRSGAPHEEVVRELIKNRHYCEVLGAFAYNAAVSEDTPEELIAVGPYDMETLCQLGFINGRGNLTRRGEVVLQCLQLDREALDRGEFEVTITAAN